MSKLTDCLESRGCDCWVCWPRRRVGRHALTSASLSLLDRFHLAPCCCVCSKIDSLRARGAMPLVTARACFRFPSHNLLPLRPWPFLVESVGIGVTSSILPIFSPFLARALMADCAPGPGVFVSTPPRPRSLMWIALIPTSWSSLHTSTAASIAKTGNIS